MSARAKHLREMRWIVANGGGTIEQARQAIAREDWLAAQSALRTVQEGRERASATIVRATMAPVTKPQPWWQRD